jgi:tetratricopeptide (TPR) repeat protein
MTGVALFLPVERNRLLPLAPLFLFSGLWISEWVTSAKGRAWGRVMAAAGAALLAALLINWPLTGPALLNHERYWTGVNLGMALRARASATGDEQALAEARAWFVNAHEILPGRLEPIRQLAKVAETRNRFQEALEWQKRLLHILRLRYSAYVTPRARETECGLLLALKANRIDEAIRMGRELAGLAPADPRARHLRGVALMAAGRRDEARHEFEQTLRLAPEHFEARQNLLALDRTTSPSAESRGNRAPAME